MIELMESFFTLTTLLMIITSICVLLLVIWITDVFSKHRESGEERKRVKQTIKTHWNG